MVVTYWIDVITTKTRGLAFGRAACAGYGEAPVPGKMEGVVVMPLGQVPPLTFSTTAPVIAGFRLSGRIKHGAQYWFGAGIGVTLTLTGPLKSSVQDRLTGTSLDNCNAADAVQIGRPLTWQAPMVLTVGLPTVWLLKPDGRVPEHSVQGKAWHGTAATPQVQLQGPSPLTALALPPPGAQRL